MTGILRMSCIPYLVISLHSLLRLLWTLAKCHWIEEGKNLVITGKTSSGKSYFSNALAICAIRQFKTVKYYKASILINELSRAEKNETYNEFTSQLSSYDLLIVDDFGLMNLDIDKCRNLFEVFDSRDPYKSILLVSQIPVKSWYDLFVDHTYAEASLARVLHDSYRLEMNGKNMRNLEPINNRKNGWAHRWCELPVPLMRYGGTVYPNCAHSSVVLVNT